MALIKCPECGHDVSDRAISCPYCGFPVERELKKQREQEQKELEKRTRLEETNKEDQQNSKETLLLKEAALKRIEESMKNPELNIKKDTVWICPVCGKVTPFYFSGKCCVCGQTYPINTNILEKDARIAWGNMKNGGYDEEIRKMFYNDNPQRNEFWEAPRLFLNGKYIVLLLIFISTHRWVLFDCLPGFPGSSIFIKFGLSIKYCSLIKQKQGSIIFNSCV